MEKIYPCFVILIVKGPSSPFFVISFCNSLSKKRYETYELNWSEWIQTELTFLKPLSKITFWHLFYIFYNNLQNYKPSKSRFNDSVSSYPCLEIMNSNFNVILVEFPSKWRFFNSLDKRDKKMEFKICRSFFPIYTQIDL